MTPSKTPVIIYGAGGYGGVGLVEILSSHPGAHIEALVSREGAGLPYSQLYPHLQNYCELTVQPADNYKPPRLQSSGDKFVFFSTPDGVGQSIAGEWLDAGYRIIDFSGDFRFKSAGDYLNYSKRQQGEAAHQAPGLLSESVYGCPELYRSQLGKARIAGNPGCMAIACLLPLAPLVTANIIETETIICDVKTGISGAGKKLKPAFHFPAADGNFYAYKVLAHQHVCELEHHLQIRSRSPVCVDFVPHVIPATRGIFCTAYLKLRAGCTAEHAFQALESAYSEEPFVHLNKIGQSLSLSDVRGSNQCRISLHPGKDSGRLVLTSVIDNLQKGQSGNAVQVFNIMAGFDETAGLNTPPRFP